MEQFKDLDLKYRTERAMIGRGRLLLVLLAILLTLGGCRKALQHPEASDPVYRDLRREANKAYGMFKEKEKTTLAARKAFDEAPIRTGQRLDAQEDYFTHLHEQEKYAEKYRYLALKAELRQKHDVLVYPEIYKAKKPWPDPEDFEEYEAEKRLATAPKEWDPENRIKQRKLASEAKKTAETATEE